LIAGLTDSRDLKNQPSFTENPPPTFLRKPPMTEEIESPQKNVFGEPLQLCSEKPLTGWFRDGCCNTDEHDRGQHTVCAKVSDEFLEWLKEDGNDLITPHPQFGFPGLKAGDCWCVCAGSYARALEAGVACKIYLSRTHIGTLNVVPMEKLKAHALDLS